MGEGPLSSTAAQPCGDDLPPVVIEPLKGWLVFDFREFWEYRELLYFLVWKDVKVRYKQTLLGGLWAVLQPFLTMVVFSVFFGMLAQMPSDGIPYPVFAFVALLPWQLFANTLNASGMSLVLNQSLVTKVYFPRLMAPLSAIFVSLIDFLLTFVVLIGMMAYYGVRPNAAVLALPLFLLLALGAAFSVGIWLAALNVRYRDVRFIIPFLTQFWLFITPVAYSASLVPERWRAIYGLNPMVGVVEGFRWALLGQRRVLDGSVAVSALVVVLLLASGLIYFNRTEKTFADEL
jgi:lipopolysaccharide transport system permease protein